MFCFTDHITHRRTHRENASFANDVPCTILFTIQTLIRWFYISICMHLVFELMATKKSLPILAWHGILLLHNNQIFFWIFALTDFFHMVFFVKDNMFSLRLIFSFEMIVEKNNTIQRERGKTDLEISIFELAVRFDSIWFYCSIHIATVSRQWWWRWARRGELTKSIKHTWKWKITRSDDRRQCQRVITIILLKLSLFELHLATNETVTSYSE